MCYLIIGTRLLHLMSQQLESVSVELDGNLSVIGGVRCIPLMRFIAIYSLVVNFTQNFDHVDIFREFAVPHFGDRIEARVIFDVAKSFVHAFGD